MSRPQKQPNPGQGERRYWLDRPANVNKIVYLVCVVCVLLVLGDLFYEKHPHFAFEEWFGFFGFFGFIACVFLVLAAKKLRTFLMRDEDYYE